jgi:RND family efflux transporter MFP subunit
MSKLLNKKRVIGVLATIVILAVVVFGWSQLSGNDETANATELQGQVKTTGKVMKTDITDEIFTDGYLEMESESVYMETDGIVEEVLVKEGEYVEEGQVLLRLSRENIKEQIEDAAISMSDAAISYDAAKRNMETGEALYAEGAITENDLLSRQENLSKSYNSYVTRQTTLERLNEDYNNMEVKAVASGILLNIVPTVSDKVLEDTEIAEIAVSERMTLTVDIEEYDVPSVNLGTQATITVSALDQDYEGTVISISPIAKTGGTVAMVEAVIELTEVDVNLIPGYSAEVSIKSVDLLDVAVVPYTAIRTIGGQDVIFLIGDDDTLQMQEVESGYEDVIYTQIMNVDLVGSLIMITALPTMKDGMTLVEAQTLIEESTGSQDSSGLMMMPGSGGGAGRTGEGPGIKND